LDKYFLFFPKTEETGHTLEREVGYCSKISAPNFESVSILGQIFQKKGEKN
jgi:hypothetical protein